MGGTLGPTLANLFLCYYEQLWLNSCSVNFDLYSTDDSLMIILWHLRIYHMSNFLLSIWIRNTQLLSLLTKLKMTITTILIMIITKDDSGMPSSAYRKPTFTGLGLNFISFIPYIYKINSIHTLLQRAYSVSSSYVNFHAEIEYLKDYFY